jgi:hypothetical protein
MRCSSRTKLADSLSADAGGKSPIVLPNGGQVMKTHTVEDPGQVIHVRVRGDAVARALEDARGERFNRGPKALFTWCGRSNM